MKFKEILYDLNEGISVTKTNYGTNLINKEWLDDKGSYRTCFEYQGDYFIVSFVNNGSIFSVSFYTFIGLQKPDFEKIFTNRNYSYTNLSIDLDNKKHLNSISVYSRVFYILFDGCDKLGIKQFKFEAAPTNKKKNYLVNFYISLFKNNLFIKKIQNYGYNVSQHEKKDGFFWIFSK